MTRDEAVEAIWTPKPPQDWAMGKTNAEHLVDQLVALGVLRIDKPQSVRDRFRAHLSRLGYMDESSGMTDALKAFDAATK